MFFTKLIVFYYQLQLYYRRLHVTKMHPDLRRLQGLIRSLGVDGMSSDESDVEVSGPVYGIKHVPWRGDIVTLCLRQLDSIHLSLRTTTVGRLKRGNLPRIRRDNPNLLSERGPVGGLPMNCYNPEWFATLTENDKEDLEVLDEFFDLTLPQSATTYIISSYSLLLN